MDEVGQTSVPPEPKHRAEPSGYGTAAGGAQRPAPSSAYTAPPQALPPPPAAPRAAAPLSQNARDLAIAGQPVNVPQGGKGFVLDIYSRDHRLENGTTFSSQDPTLGELGQGDIKAKVTVFGALPKGKLMIEWVLDQVPMDAKIIRPNSVVEYGNEPTPGTYRVVLRLDAKPVQTFTFRITP